MKYLVITVILLLTPSIAEAQTKLGPNQGVKIDWPSPTVSPDNLDSPDGFRVKALSTTSTGVVVKSWDVAGSAARTFTITPTEVPNGLFQISVNPYNVAGEAAASNLTGPFGKAVIPRPYTTGVTAGVVGVP